MHARHRQCTNAMSNDCHFHLSCLRKLLKIRWQDKIPDTEVLKRSEMQSLHTLLKPAQLRWTDHVARMPDERIFYGELHVGKRSQDGQKKRYKNTLKVPMKDFNTPPESREQIAQDRPKGSSPESTFSELTCSICNRQ